MRLIGKWLVPRARRDRRPASPVCTLPQDRSRASGGGGRPGPPRGGGRGVGAPAASRRPPLHDPSTAARRARRHVDCPHPAAPTTSASTASPISSSPHLGHRGDGAPTTDREHDDDGTTISDVTVTADLRDLTSDNSFRTSDQSEGLSRTSSTRPRFVLTSAIALSAVRPPARR